MAETPEELAVDMSRASLRAQEQIENQIREKATAVLSAASILVPIAVFAIGHGPPVAAVPFAAAAIAYFLCARACGEALSPRDMYAGLLGSELLEVAKASGADLRQVQAAAASYLDRGYRTNRSTIARSADRLRYAILMLRIEILALVVALLARLVTS